MQRATTRGRNATGRHYNSSTHLVKPEVIACQFRFRDFLGSREGSIWRGLRATTPCLVSSAPALAMLSSSRGAPTGNGLRDSTPTRQNLRDELLVGVRGH